MIFSVFIRFVVGSDGQNHKALTGIFFGAWSLRKRCELTAEEEVRLDALYGWFNVHVPVPPFATGRFSHDAVAWFKDHAREPVAKMWDIVTLLREHGVEIRFLRSPNPGKVVYEDRVQVLVEQWNQL